MDLRHALACLSSILVAGCIGNATPYRPGWQDVPEDKTSDDELQQEMAHAIPMEIARTDWYLHQGREEVRRITGSVARNPWRSYEHDMATTLGDHASEYLHRDVNAILAKPAAAPSPQADEEKQDASADEEKSDDGGSDDGWGDDDW